MDYPESFERLIGNSGYDYIGNGNPNAKILIIAKEPAIDMESGKGMYGHDILGNRGLWIKHDDAVEFPYRGQKCHIYIGPDNKTGKVRVKEARRVHGWPISPCSMPLSATVRKKPATK